ncbi:MAG: fimbrial assembly protein FimA [Frankiales bacterium]|nr:fimbrial assembly protein FimA [Frankiales bacterium]
MARSADGSQWGVAVASKFLAVGAAVPAAQWDVGAVATQSYCNLAYRPDGLRLLAEGNTAQQTLDALVAADELREQRQAGIVDRDGGAATWTGAECNAWAGGRTGDGWAAQGNILTGPEVVDVLADTFTAAQGTLAHRLSQALLAADRAGGDRRGRQAAALLVVSDAGGYGGGSDVLVDLRVDDHPDPVPELMRLLDLHDLYFGKPESVLPLEGELAVEVADRLARLGFASLDDWAGVENYEERMVSGGIDPVVLAKLREATG